MALGGSERAPLTQPSAAGPYRWETSEALVNALSCLPIPLVRPFTLGTAGDAAVSSRRGRETEAQTQEATGHAGREPRSPEIQCPKTTMLPMSTCPLGEGGGPCPWAGGARLLQCRGMRTGPLAHSLPSLKKLCWEGRDVTKLGLLAAEWGPDGRWGDGKRLAQPWAGAGGLRAGPGRWGCSRVLQGARIGGTAW